MEKMRSKKTVNVESLRIEINRRLANSTCERECRLGMIAILENVLMDSENYKGFRYLEYSEVPEGHLAGINDGFKDEGYSKSLAIFSNHKEFNARFKHTDDSRRYYF
jgi:hypothetical protein